MRHAISHKKGKSTEDILLKPQIEGGSVYPNPVTNPPIELKGDCYSDNLNADETHFQWANYKIPSSSDGLGVWTCTFESASSHSSNALPSPMPQCPSRRRPLPTSKLSNESLPRGPLIVEEGDARYEYFEVVPMATRPKPKTMSDDLHDTVVDIEVGGIEKISTSCITSAPHDDARDLNGDNFRSTTSKPSKIVPCQIDMTHLLLPWFGTKVRDPIISKPSPSGHECQVIATRGLVMREIAVSRRRNFKVRQLPQTRL